MTKEQLAASLDGCQYRDEVKGGFAKLAKEAGLVIIYGASDDLMEFEGAVYDEIGGPCEALLYNFVDGWKVVDNDMQTIREIDDDDEMLAAASAYKEGCNLVKSEWCPKDFEGSWRISTDLPNATFDVMEDDELYCQGIVIDTKDLK